MTNSRAATIARQVGILSLASGVLLILTPRRMAKLYALPSKPAALPRWLGVRDVTIGACLLRPSLRGVGGLLRSLSDLGDFSLMLHEARRSSGGVGRIRGRLATALLSALSGFVVATAGHERRGSAA
jgi:hypothetical protein